MLEAGIQELKEKEIYKHLDELEESEFVIKIYKDNKVSYAFRHPLFHEATYNSLLKSERIIYHKVIAETIETKFKDEIDGYFATQAQHYYNCENFKKTLEYSIKAGDEAASLYANEEALIHYNRALSVADDDSAKATIFEKIEAENKTNQYWTNISLIPIIQFPIKTKENA